MCTLFSVQKNSLNPVYVALIKAQEYNEIYIKITENLFIYILDSSYTEFKLELIFFSIY